MSTQPATHDFAEERTSDGTLRIAVTTFRRRAVLQAVVIALSGILAAIVLLLVAPLGSRRWIYAAALGCLSFTIGLANFLIAMLQPASSTHSFEIGGRELVVNTFLSGDAVTERHPRADIVDIRVQDDSLMIVTVNGPAGYLHGQPGSRLRAIATRLRDELGAAGARR